MKALVANFLSISVFFGLLSCGDDSVEPVVEQIRFNGVLLDANSGDPIPNISISFHEELGCQATFGRQYVGTDATGAFEIKYAREMDTIQAAATAFDLDLSLTFYSINVWDEFVYLDQIMLGDMEIQPYRDTNLVPNGEMVTIMANKVGQLSMSVLDESIDHTYVQFDINLEEVDSFVPGFVETSFGSQNIDVSGIEEVTRFPLEAGKIYNFEITIREGDSYETIEDWPVTKTVLFENIQANWRERISLERIIY